MIATSATSTTIYIVFRIIYVKTCSRGRVEQPRFCKSEFNIIAVFTELPPDIRFPPVAQDIRMGELYKTHEFTLTWIRDSEIELTGGFLLYRHVKIHFPFGTRICEINHDIFEKTKIVDFPVTSNKGTPAKAISGENNQFSPYDFFLRPGISRDIDQSNDSRRPLPNW